VGHRRGGVNDLLSLYPQVHSESAEARQWNGYMQPSKRSDEVAYSAYVNALMDRRLVQTILSGRTT